MADALRDLQVAESFLQDVRNGTSRVERNENPFTAIDEAGRIYDRDWTLAMKRIDKAEAQGVDVTQVRAQAYFVLGNLSLRAAERVSAVESVAGLNRNREPRFKDWMQQAIDSFTKSVRIRPSSEAWFNLGLAWIQAGNQQYAIQCFQQAEAADDEDISIIASKMIDRLQAA